MIIEIHDKAVYDIYLNGRWVASRAAWKNVIDYVTDMLEEGHRDD